MRAALPLLGALLAVSAAPAKASMPTCLLPGSCSQKQMIKALFPDRFRPVTGCVSKTGAVRRGSGRRVALTFDDGPWVETDQLISLLNQRRVKATFFVVGRQVEGNEKVLSRMYRSGHAIGNHSWAHPMLTALPDQSVKDQMLWTQLAVKKATGYSPCLMRPPYGALDARVQGSLGRLQPVLWDVDAADWESPPAEVIAARTLAGAKPGSIILLHDGGGDRSQTVAAVPAIIKGLRQRGFKLVTVPKLLGLKQKR